MEYFNKLSSKLAILVIGVIFVFSSCDENDTTPTKTKMESTWEVTEAYKADGTEITQNINFPITAFHLSSDNGIISTAGPMMMYIVYGDNQYTNIMAKVDQVFNYASLNFNGGEFFVGGGKQSRFTLEMKLEGLPGQQSLTTLLDLLGITNDWLDVVVYHKFRDVRVAISTDGDTMTWEFDDETSAVYNTKNNFGDYVLWNGWPIDNFQRCRFVLKKRTSDLQDLVTNAK